MASTSKPALGLAIVAVLLFLAYRYVLYPTVFSPLAKIPSAHWSASLSRLWILHVRWSRRENRVLLAAHRRLGPVVRVGPRELSINDVDSVRVVYQGGFDKDEWYSVFDNYGVRCMFSALPSREHSTRKRMISNVYSKSFVQSSSASSAQARAIIFDRLLPILGDSTLDTQIPHGIDVYSVFMATSMDFITAYILGLAGGTNFLARKALREHFFELYKSRKDYSFYDQELPRLTALGRKIGFSVCPRWVDDANREIGEWFQRLCEKATSVGAMVEKSSATAEDEPVVWNAVVSGLEKEREAHGAASVLYHSALSHTELAIDSELLDHVLAGQETTGLALTYLTWRLSQSLDLQAELRAELLTLSPNMALNKDNTPPSLPDAKALDALPVLHAVVTETLRLHAPIPGPQPRRTPTEPGGCRIGPYRGIPGGVRVAALAHALHRDERAFPDPETWDHARWLPSSSSSEREEAERLERNRLFWAFGSGGRMCVASNFAIHEIKLVTAAIYSNFTTHIVDDEGMAEQSDGYTTRPGKEQLYIRLERVQ